MKIWTNQMHSFYFIAYSFESHLLRSNLWLPWWLEDLALSFMAESIRSHIERSTQETGSTEFRLCSFIFMTLSPKWHSFCIWCVVLQPFDGVRVQKGACKQGQWLHDGWLWVLCLFVPGNRAQQRCGSHGMAWVWAPFPGSSLTQREVWTVWTLGLTSAGPHRPSPLPPIRRNILPGFS